MYPVNAFLKLSLLNTEQNKFSVYKPNGISSTPSYKGFFTNKNSQSNIRNIWRIRSVFGVVGQFSHQKASSKNASIRPL